MKRPTPSSGSFARSLVLRLLPLTVLLGFSTLPTLHARENKFELPLILDSERAQLRSRMGTSLSETIYYERVIRGHLQWPGAPMDYEPVGLHIDPNWSIQPERPVNETPPERGKTGTRGPADLVPLRWMAQALSRFSNKNVLMSARVEKRLCEEFRVSGTSEDNVESFGRLLEKEGIEAKLLPHDAIVLLEAPGKERPFRYPANRPRAVRYEEDREAWLVKHKNYIPQGLIYQPTQQAPADFPRREIRIRHVASLLARLTGKEVFVQPVVEKWDFEPAEEDAVPATPELEIAQIKRQLDKANVEIVELNAHCIALVLEGAKIKSLSELR